METCFDKKENEMKKVALIFVIISFVSSGVAFACSCLPTDKSMEEYLNDYDLVFVGTVTSKNKRAARVLPGSKVTQEEVDKKGPYSNLIDFDVKKVWKQVPNTNIRITTAARSSSCGFDFEIGKTYLVYAVYRDKAVAKFKDEEFVYGVSNCSKTRLISEESLNDVLEVIQIQNAIGEEE